MPMDAVTKCSIGDKVVAGESVLATFK
jgi:hypothetical protein